MVNAPAHVAVEPLVNLLWPWLLGPPEPPQALAVASEQCVTITETSLKNITLVNFLIILILIIVVAANVNEGEQELFARMIYF